MNEIEKVLDGVTLRMSALLRRGGRTRPVAIADLDWDTSDETGATTWQRGKSRSVSLQVWSRRPGPARAELVAGVTARQGWTLDQWTFELRIRTAGKDRFTWPFAAGAVVPVDQLAGAKRTLELTYPVYASMQWVDVFGGGCGIYAATHDAEPYFKHLRVRAEGRGGQRTLVLTFIYTDLEWPAGKEWTSPPLVLARHAGDWREGARIYRAWADTWFRRDPVPAFMRRTCGHNMISFPAGGGRLAFRELPRLAAETRRLGIDGVHVVDWMEEGFDTFYPAYKPDPTLGGGKALQRAIHRMASEGTWTCLYLNGRLLDPAGPYGKHAFEWSVKLPPHVKRRFAEMWARTQDASRPGWNPAQAVPARPAPFNRDGTAAQEWWGRIFAPMCPTVPGWQQLWLSRLSDVAATLRPRMFQVDQVCGCWGMPCYDETHPHRSPARAWSGYKAFTRAMRRRAKEVNPDAALWSEGVNDILGQAFDGLQMSLAFDAPLAGLGEWDPRIFKYTFPEYLLLTGDLKGQDRCALAWAIITGGHFHFFIPDPASLDPVARRWIRFAARVRTRYWRAFTSNDVFVPDATGDEGVRILGYRFGRRELLVGAPVEPRDQPDRAFRIEIALPDADRRLVRSEWITDPGRANVRLRKNRCAVGGRGPFAILLG